MDRFLISGRVHEGEGEWDGNVSWWSRFDSQLGLGQQNFALISGRNVLCCGDYLRGYRFDQQKNVAKMSTCRLESLLPLDTGLSRAFSPSNTFTRAAWLLIQHIPTPRASILFKISQFSLANNHLHFSQWNADLNRGIWSNSLLHGSRFTSH
jgi:hypothetical protein